MMMPEGTLTGGGGGASFARYAGLLMVVSTILLVGALVAMLVFADLCDPLTDAAGKLLIHKDEVMKTCKARFEPGGLATFMTAAGMTFGGTTVFLYRANKQNGG